MERFADRFGAAPTWAALAPGRVNLIGEHTDYCGGLVLPIAIDRHVLAMARPARADHSTLWAIDVPEDGVAEVRLADPPGAAGPRFARYVLGVADQLARRGRSIPELDLAVAGTIPIGAGLASSAALGVATATLLEQLDAPLDELDKALLCQRAEHLFAGTPCGIMDMLVSTVARRDHAVLIDCATNRWRFVPMPGGNALAVLVADTGVKHDLAAGAYARRRAGCAAAAARIGVTHLAAATADDLRAAGLPDDQQRLARHVVEEQARTRAAAAALESGRLDELGRLLFAGHESLRDLYAVSCPELDTIVEAARENGTKGVLGARMTGGGFGGCCVVLCRPEHVADAADGIAARFHERFGRRPAIFPARPVDGARRVPAPA